MHDFVAVLLADFLEDRENELAQQIIRNVEKPDSNSSNIGSEEREAYDVGSVLHDLFIEIAMDYMTEFS